MPRVVQGAYALTVPQRGVHRMRDRYGDAFTVDVPLFGRSLMIGNAAEAKELFHARTDAVDQIQPNLGRVLGPGSFFALGGAAHRRQRKLLTPPFHGRRLAVYEDIVEEETVRELARWPEGRSFPTMPSMMRITLNAILRAVFGARGAEYDRLRALLPGLVTLGSRIALVPMPRVSWGPWGAYRRRRREYDAIVRRLITVTERDDRLDERDDILALMLQCRYDDGSAMSHDEIADQLLTLLAAGHETTATTMAWLIERIRRHPALLDELVAESDAGGSALREATVTETQRVRPVIDLVGRRVVGESATIGRWTLPHGYTVLVSIPLVHEDAARYPDPLAFDPHRFHDTKPDLYQWVPFGGGTRRCIGAAFATMEMNVVLRTLLRDVTLVPTTEPDERWHNRGVANAPARGGRAVARHRTARRAGPAPTRSAHAAT